MVLFLKRTLPQSSTANDRQRPGMSLHDTLLRVTNRQFHSFGEKLKIVKLRRFNRNGSIIPSSESRLLYSRTFSTTDINRSRVLSHRFHSSSPRYKMDATTLIGQAAPAFTLPDHNGLDFTFNPTEKGMPTAIFVYPSAGSYGCTQEACQFRDAVANQDVFGPGKVQIIGLSADSVDAQKTFVEKNHLTYPVLSDTKKEVIKQLKVGRGMLGFVPVARVTYIVDKKGIIRGTHNATANYSSHTDFVEKWLKDLDEEEAKELAEPTDASKL